MGGNSERNFDSAHSKAVAARILVEVELKPGITVTELSAILHMSVNGIGPYMRDMADDVALFDKLRKQWDAERATPTAQPVLAAVGLTDDECWSDDNEMFNHQSLGELLDHNEELAPGCTVWRAKSSRPAANELFNMNSLIEDMGEQAFEFAGEYAEDFPDASKEQFAELEGLICDWIERSTTINFYKVTDVQPYVLTLADFPDDYTPPASHITGAGHD